MSRRFDPLARARSFTSEPSPRRELMNTRRRLDNLERDMSAALNIASMADAQTPIATLVELPDCTTADIGQKIVVGDPDTGEINEYTAVLSPSGVAYWLKISGTPAVLAYSFVRTFVANLPADLDIRPSDGNVMVNRLDDSRLSMWTQTGTFVETWGSTTSCAAAAGGGQISSPWGVAYKDSNETFISYRDCHKVVVWNDGTNLIASPDFLIGTGTAGSGAALSSPRGMDLNISYLYIADTGNHRIAIRDVNAPYDYLGQIGTGSAGTADGQFNNPYNVAVDSDGNVYVVEFTNHRIQKFTPGGTFVWKVGGTSAGSGNGQFNGPTGITVDPFDRIHVVDQGNNRVQVFDGNGAFLVSYGAFGTGTGQLSGPLGIAIDATGLVFITDRSNSRVSVWQEGPTVGASTSTSRLKDLTDVAIGTSPATGSFLRYSGGKWADDGITVTRRSKSQNNIANGTTQTYTINCNSGEIAVGGGCTANANGIVVVSSYPTSGLSGWVCEQRNEWSPSTADVTGYAICMKIPG